MRGGFASKLAVKTERKIVPATEFRNAFCKEFPRASCLDLWDSSRRGKRGRKISCTFLNDYFLFPDQPFGSILLAGLLGLWFTGKLWTPQAFPLFLWLSLPFNLLIYGVNDIFDYEIDQISSRKDSYQGAR